jgi:CheY-like chemotaxis protein
MINLILGDLSEKKIDPTDFVYLEPKKILPDILEKYGYKNEKEKTKLRLLLPKQDEDIFLIKAVPERLTYIVFNLLKNALYYLDKYPHSIVTIGCETREIEGKNYNVIYVHDTGPGIPTQLIPKLFDDFYTAGKKEGTGLGLAFCKRNMLMFGGDIICESEWGKWTKFSLLFPMLDKKEVARVRVEDQKKKILLVDDQTVPLLITKLKIEKNLINIACDIANSGKDAIKMAQQNKYHLILMDIEMPDMNGIETTKIIRTTDTETPIIAFTALEKNSCLEKITNTLPHQDTYKYVSDYLSKTSSDHLLYRGITKWVFGLEDNLSYIGTTENIAEILRGKKVLLADDQRVNRLIIKNHLEKNGLVVSEVTNGKELLEVYMSSLNGQGRSSFDLIATDINMPPYNGDVATKEIRKIERMNLVSYQNEIPIIALSGNGGKKDIHHFFECQMTDYFIKGSKPELLLKIMANYLCFEPKQVAGKT